jgi:hypothetical protein
MLRDAVQNAADGFNIALPPAWQEESSANGQPAVLFVPSSSGDVPLILIVASQGAHRTSR